MLRDSLLFVALIDWLDLVCDTDSLDFVTLRLELLDFVWEVLEEDWLTDSDEDELDDGFFHITSAQSWNCTSVQSVNRTSA